MKTVVTGAVGFGSDMSCQGKLVFSETRRSKS